MTFSKPVLDFFVMEAWAAAEIPTEFKAVKTKLDEIMTPSSLPPGYNPKGYGYGSGPIPDFQHWIVPYKPHREALRFKTYMCLIIGHWIIKVPPGVKKAEKDPLCAYVSWPSNIVRFCRDVDNGTELIDVDHTKLEEQEGLKMFPLWHALYMHDPERESLSMIRTIVVYLHMQRMLIPEFTGRHACKEKFKAACRAWKKYSEGHSDLFKESESGYAPFRPFPRLPPPPPQNVKIGWVEQPPGGYVPSVPKEAESEKKKRRKRK